MDNLPPLQWVWEVMEAMEMSFLFLPQSFLCWRKGAVFSRAVSTPFLYPSESLKETDDQLHLGNLKRIYWKDSYQSIRDVEKSWGIEHKNECRTLESTTILPTSCLKRWDGNWPLESGNRYCHVQGCLPGGLICSVCQTTVNLQDGAWE
jgi:hypothetical protein